MFEVKYHYYDKSDDGEYDKSQVKCEARKIGKNFEDVSLDKLAHYVISQLARRDVLVVDFQIFEFVKKEISFKETKGGVLIKNKKFMLDGTIADIPFEEEVQPPEYLKPQVQQVPATSQIVEKQPNQAIRWEVFDPDPMTVPMLVRKYKLTPKRKYPVLEEKTVIQKINLPGGGMTDMPGYEYVIIDDLGQKIRIQAMHFVPEQKGLIGMENVRMTEQDYRNAPKLMHMDTGMGNDMPVLRR